MLRGQNVCGEARRTESLIFTLSRGSTSRILFAFGQPQFSGRITGDAYPCRCLLCGQQFRGVPDFRGLSPWTTIHPELGTRARTRRRSCCPRQAQIEFIDSPYTFLRPPDWIRRCRLHQHQPEHRSMLNRRRMRRLNIRQGPLHRSGR